MARVSSVRITPDSNTVSNNVGLIADRAYRTGAPGGVSEGRARLCRVAGAVARPGSHRTVRTLFVYGSSGRRVANPAAGRLTTSIHPHSSTSCCWAGATISCAWRCSSTSTSSPRSVKYRVRTA
jgi:hypothetical protein